MSTISATYNIEFIHVHQSNQNVFYLSWVEQHYIPVTVASLEISGGNFPEIYCNLSGNLIITYVNQLFPSPALQSDAVK